MVSSLCSDLYKFKGAGHDPIISFIFSVYWYQSIQIVSVKYTTNVECRQNIQILQGV